MPDDRVKIIHFGCGEFVFWYDHRPRVRDDVWTENATLPDGSKPKDGETMTCPKCGPVAAFELEPEGGFA